MCSKHFKEDCFVTEGVRFREALGVPVQKQLKPDAVPTVFTKTTGHVAASSSNYVHGINFALARLLDRWEILLALNKPVVTVVMYRCRTVNCLLRTNQLELSYYLQLFCLVGLRQQRFYKKNILSEPKAVCCTISSISVEPHAAACELPLTIIGSDGRADNPGHSGK